MGARAYRLFDSVKELPRNSCIVEIGSQRGEGSTDYFIELARKLKVPLYTVDINYEVYIWIAHKTHAFLMSGEEFFERVLPNIGSKIGICYMDGFDWIWQGMDGRDFILAQKEEYKNLGFELHNDASQKSHVRQCQAIVDFKMDYIGTRILFDDTWPTREGYDGKGGSAVPYLLGKGYEVIDQVPVAEEDQQGYVLLEKTS